jgi:hypothetical protein
MTRHLDRSRAAVSHGAVERPPHCAFVLAFAGLFSMKQADLAVMKQVLRTCEPIPLSPGTVQDDPRTLPHSGKDNANPAADRINILTIEQECVNIHNNT